MAIMRQLGVDCTSSSATMSAPRPENIPLIATIWAAFLLDSARVQLFSSPQQAHAASTRSDPRLSWMVPGSKLRIRLARVTSAMASQRCLEITSRKSRRAMSEVATISKLPSNDTLDDVVRAIPSMRNMGAAMSRTTMATTYLASWAVMGRRQAWGVQRRSCQYLRRGIRRRQAWWLWCDLAAFWLRER